MKEMYVNFLLHALKIYSPSKNENEFSDFLINYMETNLGFKKIQKDSVGNVITDIGNGDPVVLLCGHMDTVPGVQKVEEKDNLIFGRGAVDAKSSLISMIIAASYFNEIKFNGTIRLIGVVDEEGTGLGIRNLVADGIKADYAIFGEPSGYDKITIGYKGRMSFTISCKTKPVHASAPWMSDNSIEKLVEIWNEIKVFVENTYSGKSYYDKVTVCLTRIKGGDADNVMPGNSQLTIDLRYPMKYSEEGIYDKITQIVDSYSKKNKDFEIIIDLMDETPAFETSKSSEVSRSIGRSIIKELNIKPKYLNKTGTGDMNVLGNALKIPVVTYGPGNAHLSHTDKEFIEKSEFLQSINIYRTALKQIFNSI